MITQGELNEKSYASIDKVFEDVLSHRMNGNYDEAFSIISGMSKKQRKALVEWCEECSIDADADAKGAMARMGAIVFEMI